MLVKSSKIIRNYVLREIVGTTVLSTLVLTAILLYGNLSKHDEDLFRALSISPLLFLELISLMLPFALSLGLPFGFSLAVIFCVGRWSADREILAMQSLGMKRSFWVRPILIFSFIVSLIACIASLQWSPISRGTFENRIKDMAWEDFQSWIDSGREINFKMNEDGGSNLIGGLDSSLQQKMTHASLTIGDGNFNEWKNIRILMWGGLNYWQCSMQKILQSARIANKELLNYFSTMLIMNLCKRRLQGMRSAQVLCLLTDGSSP